MAVASGSSRSEKMELMANPSCRIDILSSGLTHSRRRRRKRPALNLVCASPVIGYASELRLVGIKRAGIRTIITPLRTSKTKVWVL